MRFIKLRKPEDPVAPLMWDTARSATEAIFKVASWCMLLAVVKFFDSKSDDPVISIVDSVLEVVLFFYIYMFIAAKIEFDIIPAERRTKTWHLITDLGLNVIVAYALFVSAQMLVLRFVSAIASLQALK